MTEAAAFTALSTDGGCTPAILLASCDDVDCGGNGCGTCGDFASERCGEGADLAGVLSSYPPATYYDGEPYACESGPPQAQTRDGAVVGQCPGSCVYPQFCSNSGCGNDLLSEAQLCDDTGDCSKDSVCCSDYRLIFKSYCSTSCPLGNRACRTDLDCTDEHPDCDDGVCRELPPPDAGMP